LASFRVVNKRDQAYVYSELYTAKGDRMRTLNFLPIVLFAVSGAVVAQSPAVFKPLDSARSIEGYWQDTARRILYSRDAPPGYAYGTWNRLDQEQTYPSAKLIKRSGSDYGVVDLLYDDGEHTIKVVGASQSGIEFVRTLTFPACSMRHVCRLDGNELFCSLENTCEEQGKTVLDWRGEERYARRALCERDGRRQMQGIPVNCR
jgi:hypothetical protein